MRTSCTTLRAPRTTRETVARPRVDDGDALWLKTRAMLTMHSAPTNVSKYDVRLLKNARPCAATRTPKSTAKSALRTTSKNKTLHERALTQSTTIDEASDTTARPR
eukprot:Amastigsp_a174798_42.p6 type:complete len:106 gc:universal Amastigsp_a174798_42:1823-2140(+)